MARCRGWAFSSSFASSGGVREITSLFYQHALISPSNNDHDHEPYHTMTILDKKKTTKLKGVEETHDVDTWMCGYEFE